MLVLLLFSYILPIFCIILLFATCGKKKDQPKLAEKMPKSKNDQEMAAQVEQARKEAASAPEAPKKAEDEKKENESKATAPPVPSEAPPTITDGQKPPDVPPVQNPIANQKEGGIISNPIVSCVTETGTVMLPHVPVEEKPKDAKEAPPAKPDAAKDAGPAKKDVAKEAAPKPAAAKDIPKANVEEKEKSKKAEKRSSKVSMSKNKSKKGAKKGKAGGSKEKSKETQPSQTSAKKEKELATQEDGECDATDEKVASKKEKVSRPSNETQQTDEKEE